MSAILGLLGAAGASAISNMVGRIGEDHARAENYKYGEMQAENADARTRRLYRDLYSIPAQMSQLNEAGLSPSLFYGDAGGMSGQTGAQGGAAGTGPVTYGIDPLTLSQINLNEAQAEKLDAEAENERGEGQIGAAQVALYWTQVGATKASEQYTKSQNAYQNFINEVNNNTKNEQIWKIKSDARRAADEAQKAFWDGEKAGLQFRFDLETYETNKKIRLEELANLITSEELQYQEAQKIVEEIWQMPDYLEIAKMNAKEYANWVEAHAENLPKQLELRGKELNVEKWRIGVGAFTEALRTAGYFLGASQLGDGGYTMDKKTTIYGKDGKPTGWVRNQTQKNKLPKL